MKKETIIFSSKKAIGIWKKRPMKANIDTLSCEEVGHKNIKVIGYG
jgi:hypothetical protein